MTILLQSNLRPTSRKWLAPALHLLVWTLFIAYELVYLYFYSGKWRHIGNDLVFYATHIGLFYFHAWFVLPYALEKSKKPYLMLPLLVVAEMSIYLLLKYALTYWLEGLRLDTQNPAQVKTYFALSIWRGLYFLPFSTAYWLIHRLFVYKTAVNRAEKEQLIILKDKAELERNLAVVQNAYLQHQINPHFLFNTLSFVYSTVYKISPVASECILHLSDIMRYSLRSFDAGAEGRLTEEVEQIRKLIAINRMRYHYPLSIEAELPDVPGDLKIIPLVLLTFCENVFKHGDLTGHSRPAAIFLSVTPGRLLNFTTRDAPKRQGISAGIGSIGIQNAVKRLEYAYGKNYGLDITDTAELYQLDLWIQL